MPRPRRPALAFLLLTFAHGERKPGRPATREQAGGPESRLAQGDYGCLLHRRQRMRCARPRSSPTPAARCGSKTPRVALPHIAELLVSEGLAVRAVVDIDDDGGGVQRKRRAAPRQGPPAAWCRSRSSRASAPSGRSRWTCRADTRVTPAHVTARAEAPGAVHRAGGRVAARPRQRARPPRGREQPPARPAARPSRSHQHHRQQRGDAAGVRAGGARRARPARRCCSRARRAPARNSWRARCTTARPGRASRSSSTAAAGSSGASLETDLLEQLRGRDAAKKRPPLADGGTLFLDDVHELTGRRPGSADARPAAARVRHGAGRRHRSTRRFGSWPRPRAASTPRSATAASAPTSSIASAASRSRCRALRDRAADIQLLAEFFVARFACDHGKTASRISPRALDMLTRYPWPGNVRELANVIERAVLLCDDEVVHGHHLSPAIHAADATGLAVAVQPVRVARRLREGSAARRLARRPRRPQPGRPAAADHRPHLQLQGPQARHRLPPLQELAQTASGAP